MIPFIDVDLRLLLSVCVYSVQEQLSSLDKALEGDSVRLASVFLAAFRSQPSGDSRGGEALTDRMDNGEYHISTVDNMDTTLAELGDEFTLRDIDGKLDICSMCFIKLTSGYFRSY